MLKLRKDAQNRDVNIIVKDSRGYFTKQLKEAFYIALAIHLTLFFGFHFTELKFNYSDLPSHPTTVVAAPYTSHSVAYASPETNRELNKRIPIPPDPLPSTGSIFDIATSNNEVAIEHLSSTHNPFAPLETSLLIPKLLSHKERHQSPIQLVVSGEIHNMLLTNNVDKIQLPKLPKKASDLESTRVVFSVAIDPSSGKVCWHETQEKSALAALDVLAEEILANMQFSPSAKNLIAKGTIEVHYHLAKEYRR